ncbi:hypothetical protein AVEN_26449-1, partial [Araneus ventricosus]
MGVMYLYGLGTDETLRLAYHHLTSAAARGNTYAKGYLAAYYYKRQMFERTVITGGEPTYPTDLWWKWASNLESSDPKPNIAASGRQLFLISYDFFDVYRIGFESYVNR